MPESPRCQNKSAARTLPNDSYSPEAALSGLYLYFCAYDESQSLSQDISSPEGSFWHGIMHRQEPDPGNSGYWFRRVGQPPDLPSLKRCRRSGGLPCETQMGPVRLH